MKNKCLFFFFSFFLSLSMDVNAGTFTYEAGKIYCGLTHPAELISPVRRSTCEEQHIIQQQSGGVDEFNVVWWPASSHVRTDLWGGRPWQNSRPWILFGFTDDAEENLEKAYMLGTFGKSWSLFQHSYKGRGDSSLILADFDGVSNLLYGYSWLANLPQKYLNKFSYLSDRGHWHLLVDMVISIFVLGLEAVLAIATSLIGFVVGTLFNPIDTLSAIPGGLWLAVEATLAAVGNYATGVFAMATSGFLGLVLTPVAMVLSVLPFVILSAVTRRAR